MAPSISQKHSKNCKGCKGLYSDSCCVNPTCQEITEFLTRPLNAIQGSAYNILLSLASNTSWVRVRRGFVSQGSSTKTMDSATSCTVWTQNLSTRVHQPQTGLHQLERASLVALVCPLHCSSRFHLTRQPQSPATAHPKPKGLSILVSETDLLVVWCSYFKVQVVLCYSKMPPPQPPKTPTQSLKGCP